ncbi:hypothetical protein EON64_07395 [archaeon]|nr:MAG: hypothetical protein EON64_07395 [archaeon]
MKTSIIATRELICTQYGQKNGNDVRKILLHLQGTALLSLRASLLGQEQQAEVEIKKDKMIEEFGVYAAESTDEFWKTFTSNVALVKRHLGDLPKDNEAAKDTLTIIKSRIAQLQTCKCGASHLS